MATIAKLVIEAAVDPAGIDRGLDGATSKIEAWTRTTERVLESAGLRFNAASQRFINEAGKFISRGAAGSTIAETMLGNLSATLDQAQIEIKEKLFRGALSPSEAAIAGQRAGEAYNQALLRSLDSLRSQGLASTDITRAFVTQLQTAGIAGGKAMAAGLAVAAPEVEEVATGHGNRAGRSFAQSLTATIHRHRALIPTLAGLLLGQALGSAGDVATVEGHMAKVVETGHAAERILEQMAMLASFLLDPIPGLIAAVVGGAAAAVVKIWTHAKEETLKAREEFLRGLNQMIDAVDQLGLQKKLQETLQGDRHTGRSVTAPGEFTGGLDSMLEEQRRERAALAQMDQFNRVRLGGLGNLDQTFKASHDQIQRSIDARQPLIDRLQQQAAELTDAIMNPAPVHAGFGGQLPGAKSTAETAAKQMKDWEKDITALISLHRTLQELEHKPGAVQGSDVLGKIFDNYSSLLIMSAKLEATDPWGDQTIKLRTLRAETEKYIQTLTEVKDKAAIGIIPNASKIPMPFDRFTGAQSFNLGGTLGTVRVGGPRVAETPAGPSITDARIRVAVDTVREAAQSLGRSLLDLAGSSGLAVLRSIAGQLNPFAQVISAISTAAKPLTPFMTQLANIVGNVLAPVFQAFAPVLESLLPLIDAMLRVFSPILRALAPLFQAFVPILEALFPVIKLAAIAFTYVVQAASFLAGIFFKIAGAFTTLVGGVIASIGAVISKIPFLGGFGRSIRDAGNDIKNLGHAFNDTADGLFETADQMGKARSEINGITIDDAQTKIDSLGDAAEKAAGGLLNVPTGYKVALARFNATLPVDAGAGHGVPFTPTAPHLTPSGGHGFTGFGPVEPGTTGTTGGGSTTGGGDTGQGGGQITPSFTFAAGAIVIQGGDKSPADLADEFLREMQRRARATFGDSTRWAEVQN